MSMNRLSALSPPFHEQASELQTELVKRIRAERSKPAAKKPTRKTKPTPEMVADDLDAWANEQ